MVGQSSVDILTCSVGGQTSLWRITAATTGPKIGWHSKGKQAQASDNVDAADEIDVENTNFASVLVVLRICFRC